MTAGTDTLIVTLCKSDKGDDWKRKFPPEVKDTQYGIALEELKNIHIDKLCEAFEHVHNREDLQDLLDPTSSYFTELNDMAWYLDRVGQYLDNNDRGKYEMRVKSCDQHLYVRLFNADTEKLVLPPFFDSTKSTAKKSDLERKRGFADIILLLAPKLRDQIGNLKAKDIRDRFYWSEINITVTVCWERDRSKGTLSLKLEPTKAELFDELDENKKVIEIHPPTKTKPAPVLVVSRNTRDALCELAQVWHNKSARSVLLCAASGSGKEVLKDMLLYGYSLDQLNILQEAAPVIASDKEPLRLLLEALRKAGLVADSGAVKSRSILFLDEIHHPEVQNLRTILLRCMEDESLHIPGKETIKAEGLIYVFAASKPRAQLRDYPPSDFWTRIEHNVVMKHALLGLTREERKDVLQYFFCYFWRKVAKNWPHEPSFVPLELTDEENIKELAKAFAQELSSALIPVVSMRMIRSLINRLYSKAVYFAGTERIATGGLVKKIVADELDDWIGTLWHDIVPEHRTEMF